MVMHYLRQWIGSGLHHCVAFFVMCVALFADVSNASARSKNHYPAEADKVCRNIVNTLSHALTIYGQYLSVQSYENVMQGDTRALAHAQTNRCMHKRYASELVLAKRRFHNQHNRKIGIILPDGEDNAPYVASFQKGMQAACRHLQCDPTKDLIFKRVSTVDAWSLDKTLAHLVLEQKVSLLIGGFDKQSAIKLNYVAEVFRTPVFLVRPHPLGKLSSYTFLLSPSDELLASGLLAAWQKRRVKSVAILQPVEEMKGLVRALRRLSARYGIKVKHVVSYERLSLESMMDAVRDIFELKPGQRIEEWQSVVREGREISESTGETFDIDKHYLAPRADFDALLIPDDIKILRHFVKLFRYYRLRKPVILTGTHLWRSMEVAKPWDDMLKGAIFVDFIGSYLDLPSALQDLNSLSNTLAGSGEEVLYASQSHASPEVISYGARRAETSYVHQRRLLNYTAPGLFIDPALAAPVDFQLQGYRALLEALRLREYFAFGKASLARRLRDSSHITGFFAQAPVLYDDHHAHWPMYILELSRSGISMERSVMGLP